MQVVDTFVLVAFRDRNDPAFKKANEQVIEISLRHDVLVPSATLMEFDLELKSHAEKGPHLPLRRAEDFYCAGYRARLEAKARPRRSPGPPLPVPSAGRVSS